MEPCQLRTHGINSARRTCGDIWHKTAVIVGMESTLTPFNQIAAEITKDAADGILRSYEATPEDKRLWKPLESGRHIVGQLLECADANFYFAEYLRNFVAPADYAEHKADTAEEALKIFNDSVEVILSAINEFPKERLEDTFPAKNPRPYRWMMLFLARHMYYHWGQINYIQTLYGDAEQH